VSVVPEVPASVIVVLTYPDESVSNTSDVRVPLRPETVIVTASPAIAVENCDFTSALMTTEPAAAARTLFGVTVTEPVDDVVTADAAVTDTAPIAVVAV